MKRMLAVLAAVMTAVVSMAATITVDQVRQRYPWNGKIDIDYTVTYAAGEDPIDPNLACVDVQAIDETVTPFVTNFCWTLIPARPSVAAGKHRMTWDAAADGCKTDSDKLRFNVTIETAPDDYVRDSLINYFDGINNTGTGTHDATATVWKDLVGTCDMTLTANGSWNAGQNGLVVNGRSAVADKTVAKYKTIEVVYKMTKDVKGILLSTGIKSRFLVCASGTKEYFDGEARDTLTNTRTFDTSVVRSSAAVYDDEDVVKSIYMEGSQNLSGDKMTSGWNVSEKKLQLGSRSAANEWPWTGEVYAIRMYDRALTSQELAYNHRRDLVRFYGAGSVEPVSAESEIVRVDLRTGVRTVSKRDDILPFVWSSKNFTGFAGMDYVKDGLIAHLDAIDNEGTGLYNPNATVWKDKVGSLDFTLTKEGSWSASEKAFVASGNGCAAFAASAAPAYRTIEAVYKMPEKAANYIMFAGGAKARFIVIDQRDNVSGVDFDCAKTALNAKQNVIDMAVRSATGVYDQNTTVTRVYSDGVKDTSGFTRSYVWQAGSSKALIGDRYLETVNFPWQGSIYSLRMYNRELTDAEIAHNRQVDLARFFPQSEFTAQVKVVKLNGTDEDLTKWTEEVPGSERTLIRQKGEDAVQWNAKPGVWKAIYTLIYEGMNIYEETCLFDLRSLPPMGLFLVVQ